MSEAVFLSREQVLELHHLSLVTHGGLDGLRDPGLLDSALMQPEAASFYGHGDLCDIAAAYAFTSRKTNPSSTATSERPSVPRLPFLM